MRAFLNSNKSIAFSLLEMATLISIRQEFNTVLIKTIMQTVMGFEKEVTVFREEMAAVLAYLRNGTHSQIESITNTVRKWAKENEVNLPI